MIWCMKSLEEFNMSNIDKTLNAKALQSLEECFTEDTEVDHIKADKVLCTVLLELGYIEVVKKYNSVKKWFA